MSNLHYIQNLQIEGAGAVIDELHYYLGKFTSTSLNSRHFRLSAETMADIVRQANLGVELRKGHSWGDPIGKFTSAELIEDGTQGRGTFFVIEDLEGPKSNDVIKMIDTEVMDEMSIGFAHTDNTKVMCDTCQMLGDKNEMKPYFDWFSYYFQCDEGHRLGKKTKVKKKEILNTATYEGTVKLREISVVGTGADPHTKIIKKLQEELHAGNLELSDLSLFSESLNVELSHFNQLLGVTSGTSRRVYSLPSPQRRKPIMSEPTANPLQGLVEQLNATIETQTTRIAELEAAPSQEAYDTLQTELEDVKAQLTLKEAELESVKAEYASVAEDGTEARDLERAKGHAYLEEYYGENYKDMPECVTHIKNLDSPETTMSVLRSLTDGFRQMALSKRPRGRQSRIEDTFVPRKSGGKDFKFKKGATAHVGA